jgi:hypothetical protein
LLVRGIGRKSWRPRPDGDSAAEAIRTRAELGDQFLRELCELRDDREISAALAGRILDEFFEPAEPGQRPRLKMSVWRACTRDGRDARVIAQLRSGGRWTDAHGGRP